MVFIGAQWLWILLENISMVERIGAIVTPNYVIMGMSQAL